MKTALAVAAAPLAIGATASMAHFGEVTPTNEDGIVNIRYHDHFIGRPVNQLETILFGLELPERFLDAIDAAEVNRANIVHMVAHTPSFVRVDEGGISPDEVAGDADELWVAAFETAGNGSSFNLNEANYLRVI